MTGAVDDRVAASAKKGHGLQSPSLHVPWLPRLAKSETNGMSPRPRCHGQFILTVDVVFVASSVAVNCNEPPPAWLQICLQ
jgi:hypothetical protein